MAWLSCEFVGLSSGCTFDCLPATGGVTHVKDFGVIQEMVQKLCQRSHPLAKSMDYLQVGIRGEHQCCYLRQIEGCLFRQSNHSCVVCECVSLCMYFPDAVEYQHPCTVCSPLSLKAASPHPRVASSCNYKMGMKPRSAPRMMDPPMQAFTCQDSKTAKKVQEVMQSPAMLLLAGGP
eukprot:1146976-Pelagomonas_calceolata.AAC.6